MMDDKLISGGPMNVEQTIRLIVTLEYTAIVAKMKCGVCGHDKLTLNTNIATIPIVNPRTKDTSQFIPAVYANCDRCGHFEFFSAPSEIMSLIGFESTSIGDEEDKPS